MSNYKIIRRDELYHHGRLGQKWGVVNGPPYPLDRQTVKEAYGNRRSRSEKKVLNNESQQRMRSRWGGDDLWTSIPRALDLFKYRSAVRYSKHHQKESISDMDKLAPNSDMSKARLNINHPDNRDMKGRHYNCPNCAAAFDMVERGYDVMARPKNDYSNVESIESFWKNAKLRRTGLYEYDPNVYDAWNKYRDWDKKPFVKAQEVEDLRYQYSIALNEARDKAIDKTIKELRKQPEGSHGVLVCGWILDDDPHEHTSGYHATNYKVEKNKEVVFYDVQSGHKENYDGHTDYSSFDDCDPREIFVMRTDNLEPSDKIGEAVISRRKA